MSGEIWNVNSEDRFGDTKSLNQIEKMLEEFRRADCTVQAVDIGGLRPAGATEGHSRGRGGKDSLLQIARGTGGELFENVSFNFTKIKVKYNEQDEKGNKKGGNEFGWNVKQNASA